VENQGFYERYLARLSFTIRAVLAVLTYYSTLRALCAGRITTDCAADGTHCCKIRKQYRLWIILCTDQGVMVRMIGFCNEIRVSVDWISSMVWILLINTCCRASIERHITLIKML